MQYKLKIQKNETLKISTIQLLQLSTEENELLQLLDKSSAFVTDFFGEGEITEYNIVFVTPPLYTHAAPGTFCLQSYKAFFRVSD